MTTKTHNITSNGFSVIELSVVLVIIGVIITFSIDFIKIITEQNNVEDTKNKIEKIDTALANFVKQNGHLPCPAQRSATKPSASFAVETDCSLDAQEVAACGDGTTADAAKCVDIATGTNEEIRFGTIPTRSLGLSDIDGSDAWGRKFSYVAITQLAIGSSEFDAYTTTATDGVIEIQDSNGNQIVQTATPAVAYLILSHGKKGYGAYTLFGKNTDACDATYPLDADNCDLSDNEFRAISINDGDVVANYFDDIVSFKTRRQLLWELRK